MMMLAVLLLQTSVAKPHVTISLVPEFTAIVAGMPQRLALRFQVEPGWHIYWRNPGEGGVATTAVWTLPPGFTADSLDYPTPARLDVAGVVTHTLEGDAVFLTTIHPPAQGRLTAQDTRLTASVRYGVCKDVCYPGRATLAITLPVMTDAGPNAGWRILDSLFAARRPRTGRFAAGTTFIGDTAVISVALPPTCAGADATFFPWDRELSAAAVTIATRPGCSPAAFRLPVRNRPKGAIRGVVVVGNDPRGYEVGK